MSRCTSSITAMERFSLSGASTTTTKSGASMATLACRMPPMYQAPCCFATIRSGGGLVGESLPQLFHNPCAGGRPLDIEMHHASAIMTYNDEDIKHSESQRRNSE